MTWSIIAREPATGRMGIAVATRFFAVGSRVPHIQTGVGAVATQAFVNQSFGPRGLAGLAGGLDAEATLAALITSDSGRDQRQVHIMDAAGRVAVHTGAACIDWAGSTHGADFSIAGNMLAGPDVIAATAEAWRQSAELPLARRLMAALEAGEAAGGDKRGKQSAALLVHDGDEFPIYDLRVDDHTDPLAELKRLHAVSLERYVHFRRYGPTLANPWGLEDRSKLDSLIAASIAEGYE